ncbi:unnamed protein product [Closterium sp. NIES-54]
MTPMRGWQRRAAMCRRCSSAPRSSRCSITCGTTSSPPSTLSRTSGHLSGYDSRFCWRTSGGATRVVVLPTKLLRGMEPQEAAEEEGEGEAEAMGEALAEGEAKVTTTRSMGALVAGRAPEWRVPAGTARRLDICGSSVSAGLRDGRLHA